VKIKVKLLLLLFTVVGVLLSSCSTTTPVVSSTAVILTPEAKAATATLTPLPESLPSKNGPGQVLLFVDWPNDGFLNDAAKIMAITLENNILQIQVAYQGGCQEHIFELHAATAFLQSLPPQALLYLSHDSHGDTCTENMEKVLSFDLMPLNPERDEPGGHPLILRVHEPVGGSFAQEPYRPLIEWP
jgi:hypothetical protein